MLHDADLNVLGDGLFVNAIKTIYERLDRPILVGLSGPQGSGKSTTAGRLATELQSHGLATIYLSLDDFYYTRREREVLARDVHPLFATRGAPGTHDLHGLLHTLDGLIEADAAQVTSLPVFDKLRDDRMTAGHFRSFVGRPEVILIEGWCLGCRPQPVDMIQEPLNCLERDEDCDASWRGYVNACLAAEYASLNDQFDLIFMLKAPSFSVIYDWRTQQERWLASQSGRCGMSSEELLRFVSHFERLTRWLMDDEPVDFIADLDTRRRPVGWRLAARNIQPRPSGSQ